MALTRVKLPRPPGGGRVARLAAGAGVVSALLVNPLVSAALEQEPEARYVVEPGDTLWGIARRHGVSFDALVAANEIADPDGALWVGKELRIPASEPVADGAEEGEAPVAETEEPEDTPPVSSAPLELWPAHERADALLARAERKLAAAHFEEALEMTEQARELLDPIARTRRAKPRLAELEVSAATVYVAMARRDEALDCFRRALAAEPSLELDPAVTPPKVLRVFREAQSPPGLRAPVLNP